MNETLKTIAERYSCRAFTNKIPTDAQLEAISGAAVAAPSGMNRQPWRIILVRDKALIDEMDAEGMNILSEAEDKSAYERMMSRGGTLFYHAPCMFIVTAQQPENPSEALDCGIAVQNIALAASSLGLGNVICGMARTAFAGDKAEYFKQRLGFQKGFQFAMSVLVGYAEKPGEPHRSDFSKIIRIG